MKITRTLLLSTILVSFATQHSEARPLRNLRTAEPSVELNLSVLSDLRGDFINAEPLYVEPETKKPLIKKKKLQAVAGTENSPKLAAKQPSEKNMVDLPWLNKKRSIPQPMPEPAPFPTSQTPPFPPEDLIPPPPVSYTSPQNYNPRQNDDFVRKPISAPFVPKELPIPLKAEKKSDEKTLPERSKVNEDFKIKQRQRIDYQTEIALPESTTNESLPVIPNPPINETNLAPLPKLPLPQVPEKPPEVKKPIIPPPPPAAKVAEPVIPAVPVIPAMPSPPPLAPSAANGQRVVQLPPLNFGDEQKKPVTPKVATLPPVSDLFPNSQKTASSMPPQIELPAVPARPVVPPLASTPNDMKLETPPQIPIPPKAPELKVGKPETETVMVAPPKLPPVDVGSSSAPALTIPLTAVENELPVSREGDVSAIAAKLKADPKTILTIKSYAGGTEDQASQAKRTSLSRALSVRKFLMEKEGVSSERISVRPMGNKNEGGVPDRIDIFLEKSISQRG